MIAGDRPRTCFPLLRWSWLLLVFVVCLATPCTASAERIGELVKTEPWEQVARFFDFSDHGLRVAFVGALFFGAACGLLGSFIVVRKMALVGDAISHAVLPGVALGFLWGMQKDPLAILIGASGAGLLGSLMVNWIQRTTRIKQDAALGIVLASFFAVGLCMIRMIQNGAGAAKISGLKNYLFGDIGSLDSADLTTMAVVVIATVALVALLYRPLLAISFDRGFAASIGLPVRLLDGVFQLFLAFAIVVSLQAVGVVLVSALLITPAAAAYLLCDRMHRMLWVAMLIGMLSAVLGVFLSFLGNNLPTGPFMVLGASSIFLLAYLFAPRHGRFTKWMRHRARSRKVRDENALKAIYRILESEGRPAGGVGLPELAGQRGMSPSLVLGELRLLARRQLVELGADDGDVSLTAEGARRAQKVVRNHRLWELYLTREADYAPDHVHDDAEKIEHFLTELEVAELERQLDFPQTDPHGMPIPGVVMSDE